MGIYLYTYLSIFIYLAVGVVLCIALDFDEPQDAALGTFFWPMFLVIGFVYLVGLLVSSLVSKVNERLGRR
jgi:hypothetical protein